MTVHEPPGANHVLRSPIVARWAMSRLLKRRRLELGIPVTRISEELGLSRTRWSQIENDHNMIAVAMIPAVAELFELDAAQTADLLALREAGGRHREAWWSNYLGVLPDNLVRYCGLEEGATSLRTFGATIINGLLQSQEYAFALITTNPDVSEFDRRMVLDMRLKRQARLREAPRLRMQAIVYEAALRAELGSQPMLRRQLEHLTALIHELEATLEVRVLPFSSSPCEIIGAPTIHLLEFSRPDLQTVVWEEGWRGALSVESDDLADVLTLIFSHALERCLDREQSLDFIDQVAQGLAST